MSQCYLRKACWVVRQGCVVRLLMRRLHVVLQPRGSCCCCNDHGYSRRRALSEETLPCHPWTPFRVLSTNWVVMYNISIFLLNTGKQIIVFSEWTELDGLTIIRETVISAHFCQRKSETFSVHKCIIHLWTHGHGNGRGLNSIFSTWNC